MSGLGAETSGSAGWGKGFPFSAKRSKFETPLHSLNELWDSSLGSPILPFPSLFACQWQLSRTGKYFLSLNEETQNETKILNSLGISIFLASLWVSLVRSKSMFRFGLGGVHTIAKQKGKKNRVRGTK